MHVPKREIERAQDYDWPGNVLPYASVETPVIPEEEWRRRENTLAALRQAGFRISGKGGAGSFLAFTLAH